MLDDDGRYSFYAERSSNHAESRRFAERQLAAARRTAAAIARAAALDAEYVVEAVALVATCRETLVWSYAYAYGERCDAKRDLFACAQKHLEVFTEELSGLTELPANEIASSRQRIVFCGAALEKYRSNIASWGSAHTPHNTAS